MVQPFFYHLIRSDTPTKINETNHLHSTQIENKLKY